MIFMKDLVSFADFAKLEIKIGLIEKVEIPEGSEHVYRMTVDFGGEIGKRIIFAGLKKAYEVKDLEGKQGVFVVNLEPKKMPAFSAGKMGEESQGMLLAVDVEGEPVMLVSEKEVPKGSVVR